MYYLIITVASFLVCIFLLLAEISMGIGWDYHPDSVTYIENSRVMTENIFNQNFFSIFNNLYYIISDFLQSNVSLLVTTNILFYIFTNLVIGKVYKAYMYDKNISKIRFWVLLSILSFNPYRVHLAVHVLKDTLVIFCLCVLGIKNKWRYPAGLVMLMLRLGSVLYLIQFISKRQIKYLGIMAIIVMCTEMSLLINFLSQKNMIQMQFRDFDQVPNFSQLGELGIVLRGILWPFFILSGTFIVLSPSVFYVPIAISSIIMQIWCFIVTKKLGVTWSSFIVFVLFALLVTGFNSYLRYCYPVLVAIPVFLMQKGMYGYRKKNRFFRVRLQFAS